MKQEEVLYTTEPVRLTEKDVQSYAKSMPDHLEAQDIVPEAQSSKNGEKASDPEQVLKAMLERADKVVAEITEKIQAENDESKKNVEENDKDDKENTTDSNTTQPEAEKQTTSIELASSKKSSLFDKFVQGLQGTDVDPGFLSLTKDFSESLPTLPEENIESLKEWYEAFQIDSHDPRLKLVGMVAHKLILDVVGEKVDKDIFLKAVALDTSVSSQQQAKQAEEIEAVSAKTNKLITTFIDSLDKKPSERWDLDDLAEALRKVKETSADKGIADDISKQVTKLLETVIVKQAEENGVTETTLQEAVTDRQVREEEPVVVAQATDTRQVPDAPVPAEDHVVAVEASPPGNADSTPPAEEDAVIATQAIPKEVKPAAETKEPEDVVVATNVVSFEKDTKETSPLPPLRGGLKPEDALVIFRAYKRNIGEVLTKDEESLAAHGYAPDISGGSPTEEKGEAPVFPLPEAARVTSRTRLADSDEPVDGDDQMHDIRAPRTFEPTLMGAGGRGGGSRRPAQARELDPDDVDIDPFTPAGLKNMIKESLDSGMEQIRIEAEAVKDKMGNVSDATTLQGLVAGFELQRQFTIVLNDLERMYQNNPTKLNEEKTKYTNWFINEKQKVLDSITANPLQRSKLDAIQFAENIRRTRDAVQNAVVELAKTSEYENPQNMNEIAKIIGREEPIYGKGGKYALLDEAGNFIEENFMHWIQDKFLYFHGQDPDNPQQFFDLIAVDSLNMLRPLSVNTLLKKQNTYFRTKEGVQLDNLYNYLTDFVWLVGTIRNVNAEYINQMSDDNKIGELIASVMKSNVLTKRSAGKDNTMEAVATLSSSFRDWGNVPRVSGEARDRVVRSFIPSGKKWEDLNDDERQECYKKFLSLSPDESKQKLNAEIEKMKQEKQNIDIGDGVAVAYLMYYNMADLDYLRDRFGDTNFLKKDGMLAVLRKSAGVTEADSDAEMKDKIFDYLRRGSLLENVEGSSKPAYKSFDEWFAGWYKDGTLRKEAEGTFVTFFNIFDPYQKNPNQYDMANRLIQLVVGERLNQHKPADEKQSLDQIVNDTSAGFAQLLASFMTYFTGAAAKNDISVAAINAASKMRWIQNYKKKQGARQRAGGFGNIYNYGGLQQSYIDMMVGLPTESGDNIIEIFEQKEQALKNNAPYEERNRISHKLLFKLNDAKQYGAAGPPNMIKIFHQEIEGKEIEFNKFTHVDAWGHVSYKPDAMLDAVQDAIIKPTRYAWSTNKAPFEKDVRILVDDDAKPPKYRLGTQFEEMYNPELRRVIQEVYLREAKGAKPFLNPDGTITRYAVNNKGEFVDRNNQVIDTTKRGWRSALVMDPMNGKLDPDVEKSLNSSDFRRSAVKGYLIKRFSAQLQGHTSTHSPYEWLSYGIREDIIRALSKIPILPEADEDDFTHNHIGSFYLNADDIRQLRRLSKNRLGVNFLYALGSDLSKGFMGGLKEFWSRFLKAVGS